jgi:hypothetical protein
MSLRPETRNAGSLVYACYVSRLDELSGERADCRGHLRRNDTVATKVIVCISQRAGERTYVLLPAIAGITLPRTFTR